MPLGYAASLTASVTLELMKPQDASELKRGMTDSIDFNR